MAENDVKTFMPKVHHEIGKLIDSGELLISYPQLAVQGHDPDYLTTQEWADRYKAALKRGHFEISKGMQQIPDELASMPEDTEIVLRVGGDSLISAGAAMVWMEGIVTRQKEGRYELSEVAEILASKSGCSVRYLEGQIQKAFSEGRLTFFRYGFPADPDDYEDLMGLYYGEYSTPGEINRWLTEWGAEYRFPVSTKSDAKEKVKPKPKFKLQEEAILSWLEDNDYDPLALPTSKGLGPGKPGVKAKAKEFLLEDRPDLFSDESFKKAWGRLKGGRLKECGP